MLITHKIAVAPMLDWTDRHCRYLLRLLSSHTLLYTEMVTTGALLHGSPEAELCRDASDTPVALQLGGSDPHALAQCAQLGEQWGYNEINLNVGCPSNRVQSGRFGACLMAEPDLVAACVTKMQQATSLPVTVKTRVGIDRDYSYETLKIFITKIAAAGCKTIILHARKAWLKGLSPKENREIPPLEYDVVRKIKKDFPELIILINGGINDLTQAEDHLTHVDGVMLGRAIQNNPYLLAEVDSKFHGATKIIPTRQEILAKYFLYVEKQLKEGISLSILMRPLFGFFQNQPGARAWRRYLSEHGHKKGAGVDVLVAALAGSASCSLA